MIALTTIARSYEPSDIIAHLLPEYAFLKLDPDCTWVIENSDGVVVAALVATLGNQTACLLRIAAHPDAPHNCLLALLRFAVGDLRARGYKLLIACLNVSRSEELKLARLLQRAGGQLSPVSGFVGVLTLEQAGRW